AAWQKDRSADPAFVAAKTKERDELAAERARVAGPWQPPASGSYFTNQLIPLRRALPRDPAMVTAMRALDRAVGAANLRQAQPPQIGRASCRERGESSGGGGAWKRKGDIEET